MSNKPLGQRDENRPTPARSISPFAIFLRFLKIGIIGFGGGSALIPVIEQEFVGDGKPMNDTEYLKHTVISNITPGALPVKLGATCGYQLGGPLGSLAGAYGAMLPGVCITVLIMALFSTMGSQMVTLFNYASVGISVFIVMLLLNYTLKTCNQTIRTVNWTLCGISFLLTCGKEAHQLLAQLFSLDYSALPLPLFDISTIDLMIVTFLLIIFWGTKPTRVEFGLVSAFGLCYCFFKGKTGGQLGGGIIAYLFLAILICALTAKLVSRRNTHPKTAAHSSIHLERSAVLAILLLLVIPTVFGVAAFVICGGISLPFLGNITLSTVTSFGGGEAYVSVADGFFVQTGYIGADSYYTKLVPVANALPGPILVKIAAGVGFLFGGTMHETAAWLMAAAAAVFAVGACCIIAILVLHMYEAVEHSTFIINLKLYILPVICGMLLSTSLSMLYEAAKITAERGILPIIALGGMLFWTALLNVLHRRFRIPDLVLLIGSAIFSLATLKLL